jgi:hypothetical protein
MFIDKFFNKGILKISDLSKLQGFRSILQVSVPIKDVSNSYFDEFFLKRIEKYNYYGFFPYYLHPIYQKLMPNTAYQYLIILFPDGDKVLILIKNVRITKAQYIRLIGTPISLNDDDEHQTKTVKILIGNELINQVFAIENEIDFFKKLQINFIKKIGDFDYFSVIEDRFNELDISKFRTIRGINKARKDHNVEITHITNADRDEILSFDKYWKAWISTNTNEKIRNKKLVSILLKTIQKNNMINGIIYKYKDKILGIRIYLKVLETFVIGIVNKTFSHTILPNDYFDEFNEKELHVVSQLKNRIGQQFFYFLLERFKNEGFKAFYVSGGSRAGQRWFKEHTQGDVVKYHRSENFNLD